MKFIKKETTTEAEQQAKQAQPREELLEIISKNCDDSELQIISKLVQNAIYKKIAIDYLRANLK